MIISAVFCAILFIINCFVNIQIPINEIFIAWIVSIINFVLGVKLFLFSFDKSNKQFMIFSLGSMILRLFAIILVVLVLIVVFKFQKNYFILSFLAFYFVYLMFEIYILNKIVDKSKG